MIEFPLYAYTSSIFKPVYLSFKMQLAGGQIRSDEIQIKVGGMKCWIKKYADDEFS